MVMFTEFAGLVRKMTFVIVACSVLSISPMDIPPIQAATTTLTVTVTATSIIKPSTGARALLFFLINSIVFSFFDVN